MNESIEVGTSNFEVKVITFGLSPVVKLGIFNPRRKEKKNQFWPGNALACQPTNIVNCCYLFG